MLTSLRTRNAAGVRRRGPLRIVLPVGGLPELLTETSVAAAARQLVATDVR